MAVGPGNIGRWVRRVVRIRDLVIPITRWHKVESEIAGRAVTSCGRQLAPRLGTVRQYADIVDAGAHCRLCESGS